MAGSNRPLRRQGRSLFSGLSGLVAGAAALVTAVGGLIAILVQVGVIGGGGGSSNLQSVVPAGNLVTTGNQDWVTQANAICARTNDVIKALPNPQAGTTSLEEAAGLVKSAVEINRQMLRDLGALTAPAGKEKQVQKLIRLGAEMNDSAEELQADVTLGDAAALQRRMGALSRVGKQFDRAAIGLGATTCAEGASFSDLGLPGG